MNEWMYAWSPLGADTAEEGYHLFDMKDQMIYGDTDPFASSATRPPNDTIKYAIRRGWRPIEVKKDKRGRRRVYDLGISSDGQVIPFAHRPGWHTCREPILPGVNMDGKVWAECLIPADDCEVVHRNINGMTANSQPVEWLISQKLMIIKLLPNAT